MRVLISELGKNHGTDTVEICGKVVYIDAKNKNVVIKGYILSFIRLIFLVDDGSGCCSCFSWYDGYLDQFRSYLGKHVIVKGTKSSIFRTFGIAINDISKEAWKEKLIY